ncbi:Calcium-dependent lipid-binding family protein isoform 3 [Dorcoceras hygrometricum]|uniref:Calcium-dependent lipid-binding family protein isoform 3 n=1 Tax=Dorcoceras hygrometricum TaxID=472368 RepID=A0A2Z7B420_9LAMI|nr:Calcium-dependent lipid-binding family protein isoform 3 [Dorcoceras hygrometricum]
MGPISNIGPKTSWAARDRPEQNLEEKLAVATLPEDTPDGGGGRHHITCGAGPHVPPLSRILMRGDDDDREPFMEHNSAPAAPISRNQCTRLAGNGRPASGHQPRPSRGRARAIARRCWAAAHGGGRWLRFQIFFLFSVSNFEI